MTFLFILILAAIVFLCVSMYRRGEDRMWPWLVVFGLAVIAFIEWNVLA